MGAMPWPRSLPCEDLASSFSPIQSGETLRINLEVGFTLRHPLSLAVNLDIPIPRQKELEEADAAVFAGLADAQQHEEVGQALRTHLAIEHLAGPGERLDRVLPRVVVPRNPIVLQECEEPALVLEEPSLVTLGQLRAIDPGLQGTEVAV